MKSKPKAEDYSDQCQYCKLASEINNGKVHCGFEKKMIELPKVKCAAQNLTPEGWAKT